MPTRGQAHVVIYRAFNTLTGGLQAGDVGQQTLLWSRDGGAAVAVTNSPSARSSAGWYEVEISSSEANCEVGTLIGTSSTANVLLERISVSYQVPVRLTDEGLEMVASGVQEVLTEPMSLSIDGFTGNALSQLRALPALTRVPMVVDGLITLVQGDDYFHADGRSLSLIDETGQWPEFGDGAAVLMIQSGSTLLSLSGEVVNIDARQELRFELESVATSLLAGVFDYQIVVTLASGHRVTVQMGKLKVVPSVGAE